jgi:hypothetical protein
MTTAILKKFDALMSHLNSEENEMAEEFRELLSDTKNLYVLVSNGGDGSCYPHYTMNEAFIKSLEEKEENGQLDCEDLGCDGDGFHYDTLRVPAFLTLEDMGDSDCASQDE